jgi:3-methyladenine DNA glycosylase AlkD
MRESATVVLLDFYLHGNGKYEVPRMKIKTDHRHAEMALKAAACPEKAAVQRKFFKTGKGAYAEYDSFLGVPVPYIRKISQEFLHLGLTDIEQLLCSKHNETRLLALLVLVGQYKIENEEYRGTIFNCYMKNLRAVNNWNLVDASAHYIAGNYLLEKDRNILYKLAKSKDLWERRVAIVSTFAFIRVGSYNDTLEISRILLKDREDLMHKACGWMLREVGKRDIHALERFLTSHLAQMPRTMLRYAIEKFPKEKRQAILRGENWKV